jgi:hypothetical protein
MGLNINLILVKFNIIIFKIILNLNFIYIKFNILIKFILNLKTNKLNFII